LFEPNGNVANEPIHALDLTYRKRADTRGISRDGVQAVGQRLHFFVYLHQQVVDSASDAHSIHDSAHLNGRHCQGRQRDDSKEYFSPNTHTFSAQSIGTLVHVH
jgi:hypothetical protein